MLTNCCVLFTGYAWSHVMCSAGAISALLFPLVCALCLHSECHFFLCSYVETACTPLFFCIHTCTQTYTQIWTRTGNTKPHLLTPSHTVQHVVQLNLLAPWCSIWWRSCMIFSDGKLLELFLCENTCPVFHVCCVVYHGGHSTMQHMFNFKVHTSVLAIQVRVVYFHMNPMLKVTCNYTQKPLWYTSYLILYWNIA